MRRRTVPSPKATAEGLEPIDVSTESAGRRRLVKRRSPLQRSTPTCTARTRPSAAGTRRARRPIAFLGGHLCSFAFGDDPRPEEIRAAIKNVLDAKPDILIAAQAHVVRYCEDVLAVSRKHDWPTLMTLEAPADVWAHGLRARTNTSATSRPRRCSSA